MKIIRLKTKKYFGFAVSQAARVLRKGGVVVFPTDTVYGIGVNVLNQSALRKLYALKQRRESKPTPVFVKNFNMARKLAIVPAGYEPLLRECWPGPLTAIFVSKKKLPRGVTKRGKVGLRVPNHQFLLALLRSVDFPVTGTSANVSGWPPCRSERAFLRQLSKMHTKFWPDLIIDAGRLPRRKPSTVVDLVGVKIKVIRQGPLRLDGRWSAR